ncbi:hypothetical protein RDWZM_000297 [Blomia tropicalis]|uniref:Signal transducing adapter molecule 1 n=1 Tax=Blomia tropicalis TaxID=40697 RepID=A0A9Q0M9U7_BLOTA|nr:hypothetical protein RDWZM_000297 [Blomia tropicalis]
MGLLSAFTGSTFDPLVGTNIEENTSEDWALIMDICDRVVVEANGSKECVRSIIRRFNSPIPVVVMQSLTLTDALISNCGKKLHLEVCSRDFEAELRKLATNKGQPKVAERSRQLIKKWAKELKDDPQLNLMPALYEKLKSEGVSFKSSEPKRNRNSVSDAVLKNPDAVSSAQEEADIAKAIELSLRDNSKGKMLATSNNHYDYATISESTKNGSNKSNSASMYPSFNLSDVQSNGSKSHSSNQQKPNETKEPIKVRALYDFEAAEDNELTFKAGEIILVIDNSDANWWKGSNHRGEGLFPANFVSTDLEAEPEPIFKSEKKVQFNEEIKVKVLESDPSETNGSAPMVVTEIDESRIDRLLHLLHEADPQSEKCDSEELLLLEEQCVAMMPLIDQQIEITDKRHASLTALNAQLSSALNLYHELMKESLLMDQQQAAAAAAAYSSMMPPSQIYPYGVAGGQIPPQNYDPNQMASHIQAYNQVSPSTGPYYSQSTPAVIGYQQQPQPSPQQSYMNGSTDPSTLQQQQQPIPNHVTNGPFHPMYLHQSPNHSSSALGTQPQQYLPQQQQATYTTTSEHGHNQIQSTMAHHQMMSTPSHHMMHQPSGTPGSNGVPVNAVQNIL